MASPSTSPRRIPGRLFLALGMALVVLGVLGYVAQLALHRLTLPWYLPISATLGVLFIVVALWQTRTIWRVLALVLVVLFAAAEWMFVLGGRLPEYTGPVAAANPFPAFTTL